MQESGGKDRKAYPGHEAEGYFQFMPKTAKEYSGIDPHNFGQSANAAAKKLSGLLKAYGGDLNTALMVWNDGEGNYASHLRKHDMPQETLDFPGKVRLGMEKANSVSINQTTHVTVNAANEPHAVAYAVAGAVHNEYSAAVRDMTGPVQ